MPVQRIYALFQDVADAERAIGALEDHGVPRSQIGVAARRPAEAEEAGRVRADYTRVTDGTDIRQGEPMVTYEAQPGSLPPSALAPTAAPTSSVDTPLNVEEVGKSGLTTTTPEDAGAGAAVGAGVGLIAGLGLAAAALIVPGVGPILAGGVLASALGVAAGTTVAGAAVGGAVGYLRDMGMSEQAATHYADRLNEGDYLITATIDPAQYDEVKRLLLKYNAAGVDVNVAAPAAQITAVRGADPTLAAEIRDAVPPPMTVSEAVASGQLAPAPEPRIVTETLDGTPIIPARVVGPNETVM